MQTSTAHVLQGTAVWTRLGQRVGRVYDLEFEVDTGHMTALHVRQGHWVPITGTKMAIVPWSQVVEITPEKFLVEDAAVMELLGATESLTPAMPTTV